MTEQFKEYLRLAAEAEQMTEEQRQLDETERTHYSVMDRLWRAMTAAERDAMRRGPDLGESQP